MTQRIPWLDGIRALAITGVVFCHIASSFEPKNELMKAWGRAFGFGGYGVDLFFVLSGWLLGGILISELKSTGKICLMQFYRKRWARTLPCYFSVLFLTLSQRVLTNKFTYQDLWFTIFGQTYYFSAIPFLHISWSLCVEEHFYILIAPLLLMLWRRKTLMILTLSMLIVIPIVCRSLGLYATTVQTHVRLDQCAIGVLLAFAHQNYQNIFVMIISRVYWVFYLALAVSVFIIWKRFANERIDVPLEAISILCAVAILPSVLKQPAYVDQAIRSFPVQYIATRSYSLYFAHVEAIAIVKRFEFKIFFVYWIVSLLFAIVLAELLHRCVERPFMRASNRSQWKLLLVPTKES